MELKRIEHKLTVCKVAEASNINMDAPLYFIGKKMKNCHWYAERRIRHKTLLNVLASEGYIIV